MRHQLLAITVAAFVLPAGAQSVSYTPTEREVQVARENARRDQKLADAMEKARLNEESKPVAAYIPKEPPQPAIKEHRPEVFSAGVPGAHKNAAKKKKKSA